MDTRFHIGCHAHFNPIVSPQLQTAPQSRLSSCSLIILQRTLTLRFKNENRSASFQTSDLRRKGGCFYVRSSSSSSSSSSSTPGNVSAAPLWEDWAPQKSSKAPSISDVLWPAAGAFAAMAILGKVDQILAPKGISMTIAPLGAVSAVLFATPSAPGARKYNMFVAQIGCAAIGVIAFSIFGPGWLARSVGLSSAIAFMILTRSVHPPAASLPLLFIDGVKLHRLNHWYALFPGAAGCIILCLIQEIVCYLKENLKF